MGNGVAMTARVGTMSVDGTPISRTDLARIQAEEELHADQQRRAVRVVAVASTDVDDCRMLISILGLDAAVASAAGPKSPLAEVSPVSTGKRARKRHAA